MSDTPQAGFIVPLEQLSDDALMGLVEEFVLREGTDYGQEEVALSEKNAQVLRQLQAGDVLIVFDPVDESCSLVRKRE